MVMVCRTVMQYLVAGSGPPGHEIWPEMEMWVGDTISLGHQLGTSAWDISLGHQQITKQDHFLLVSPGVTVLLGAAPPCRCHPETWNMVQVQGSGFYQHMYRRSFMTDK